MKHLALILLAFFMLGVTSFVPDDTEVLTGDEISRAISNTKYFAALPAENFRNHYQFSSYSGSDSNTGCTEEQPCQTLGFAKDICLNYTRCTFKAGEVWSPLVLTMDENYGYQVGEGVDWNTGSDVGIVIGVDPATKTVVVREVSGAGTDPDAADTLITIDNRISGGIASVTDTLGTGAADLISPSCGAGEACILYEGESYENPPIFDANNTTPDVDDATGTALFGAGGTALAGVGYFQNLVVQYVYRDGFSQAQDVDFVGLNLTATKVLNVSGGREGDQAGTSHNTGDFSCYNCYFDAIADSATSCTGTAVAFTSTGNHTLIGGSSRVDGSSDAGIACSWYATAGSHSLVNYYIDGIEGATQRLWGATLGSAGANIVLNACRTTVDGGNITDAAALVNTITGGGTTVNNLWEVTLADTEKGIYIPTLPTLGDYTLFGRGVMLHGITDAVIDASVAASANTNAVVDIEGLYQDDLFDFNGDPNNDLADAQTAADTWDLFATNSNDLNGAHQPWDGTGGAPVLPGFAIHPDCGDTTGTCYNADIGVYTCPLAAPIPKEVTGYDNDVTSLTFTGKMGAR